MIPVFLIIVLIGYLINPVSDSCNQYVLFELAEQSKNIWICRNAVEAPLFDGGMVVSNVQSGMSKYVFHGYGRIRYNNTVIDVRNNNVVLINGETMGENINAVVDPGNIVTMGAFIRTFE